MLLAVHRLSRKLQLFVVVVCIFCLFCLVRSSKGHLGSSQVILGHFSASQNMRGCLGMGSQVIGILKAPSVLIKSFLTPTLCAPFFLKRLSYCCLACRLICVVCSGFLFILSKYNIWLNIIFFLKYCQRQIGLLYLKFGFMLKLATLKMRKVKKK